MVPEAKQASSGFLLLELMMAGQVRSDSTQGLGQHLKLPLLSVTEAVVSALPHSVSKMSLAYS